MEKHSYFSFMLIFLLLSCHSSREHLLRSNYPNWFWQPPLNLSFPTAVGYSSIASFHLDKAQKGAIDDGIERLAKSIHVRIHGEEGTINGQFGQKFQEETDAYIKEHVQDRHEILATYRGDRLTIVLLGLGEATNLFTRVSAAKSSAPNWVMKLPRQPGYIYELGQRAMKHRPKNAWSKAERNARVALASAVKSHASHLRKLTGGQFNEVSQVSADVTLTGIETVARWYNARERLCHVLIRAPLTQNKE
jgi:hypothetical protein